MLERRKFIKKYLSDIIPFGLLRLPIVISNLVSEYDYQLTGKCDLTLEGHTGSVTCCSVLSDGPSSCFAKRAERLISGSNDGFLKVWNVITGKCEITIDAHDPAITLCYVLSDDRVVSCAIGEYSIKVWNLHTKECIILDGHKLWIKCCAELQDNSTDSFTKRLVSGSVDNTLKIWNLQTGKCELTLEGHTSGIYCCTVLTDGRIISGSDDGTLRIWDIQNSSSYVLNNCEMTYDDGIHSYGHCMRYCSILHDGRILIRLDDDTLKIWNINLSDNTKKLQIEKKCEIIIEDRIYYVTLLPDKPILEGSTIDGTQEIWDFNLWFNANILSHNGKCEIIMKDQKCCAVLPDG